MIWRPRDYLERQWTDCLPQRRRPIEERYLYKFGTSSQRADAKRRQHHFLLGLQYRPNMFPDRLATTRVYKLMAPNGSIHAIRHHGVARELCCGDRRIRKASLPQQMMFCQAYVRTLLQAEGWPPVSFHQDHRNRGTHSSWLGQRGSGLVSSRRKHEANIIR